MDKLFSIGCSGFYYKDWKGLFYPYKLAQKGWLTYYAKHFNSVEINATFYRFPDVSTFKRWIEITPKDFSFALKGSRSVTHLKKLKNVEESVQRFYDVSLALEHKLGSILWQLPPSLKRDDILLDNFCRQLSTFVPQFIEFRHMSWFCSEVFEILNQYNIGYCIISAPEELPSTIHVTSPAIYIRFHGKNQWYDYLYTEEELQEWSERIECLESSQAFIYFNNDYYANAVTNAKQLMDLLSVDKPF